MGFSLRTVRWLVPALLIVAWLALGSVGGPFAGKLSNVAENDSSAFLPSSAESTAVSELEREFSAMDAIPAIVVAERGAGITEADQRFLAEKGQQFADWDTTAPGPPPIPSQDGEALELIVPLTDDPRDVVDQMRQALGEGRPDGLDVYVTGPAAQVADLSEAFGGIDGLLLIVAASVVAVILVIVYRSPLLPLLVLLSSVFALALASVLVYVLADAGAISLDGQSQGILFILVFGAATDYALLLVARYREELQTTADRFTAMRTAWRATIEPIVASAGTVILGVLCLLFSDLASNQGLGPVAAIGIAASVLASVTFLPSVLAVFGRAAYWPFRPRYGSTPPESGGVWGRIAKRVDRSPRAVWVVTSMVLLVGVAFVPQLKASGTSDSDIFLNPVESVAGQEVLSRHFPGGSGAPAVVITDESRAEEVLAASKVDGVAGAEITGTADGLVRIEAVLADAADSEAAIATVERLRASVHGVEGADAKVGGVTAEQLDTRKTSERDRTVIIPIVLVVVFAVLALLLRAVVAPLVLIATVVLSFATTMGVSALVFNHVFDFPGADPAVPLFAFVFLVALGIDYNIFLMTRVREESLSVGTRQGTLRGLTVTGGVITSAGVVLAATFSALAVLPILFLAQLAFIVAFGVLLDTLVVRSLLVPALTIDIGKRVWWPSRLARDEEPVESGRGSRKESSQPDGGKPVE
ncbi:putative drug exporter of the RND superfamily [Saccharomonospora viridis]|uniref:Predicted RND superfamily drug exporter n=2 Tax=Saccharomonospora viridis TaxID=1852 RepID=C7MR92_SACVD|nr:predicted RND superfamily drug exporter [Saccharomonospora viridis DSM 43017]KHF44469.1 membrane protein [Saccharomonospora viridis]SFP65306.1 putative drug exporter of the RND superfamily [Saccharomonospora viridis]